MNISKRDFIKVLYKIIEYLYTEKTNGHVKLKGWKVTDKKVRYEVDFEDDDSTCSIVFTTRRI